MSTKIYNAYKFEGKIIELLPALKKVSKKYTENRLKFLSLVALRSYMPAKDEGRYVMQSIARKEAYKRKDLLKKRVKEANDANTRDSDVTDASAVVYFHKNNIYVQFFGDFIVDSSINKRLFKDFHYQTSTDCPENVTNREWNRREKIWDEIFGSSGIPNIEGFIYLLFIESEYREFLWKKLNEIEDYLLIKK